MFTTNEQERVSNGEFLASGQRHLVLLRGGGVRRRRPSCAGEGTEHQQDRPRDARPRSEFEEFTYTPELAGVAADIGLADALALQSMYIFKQPLIGGEVGCHQDATFLYTDPMTRHRLLVRDRGRHAGERLPVGHAGRPPHEPAQAVQARRRHRRRRHASSRCSTSAAARRRPSWCRCRCPPARWWCCTACCPTGATSTARPSAATPTRCTASPPLPSTRSGTGCSGRPTCRCARCAEVAGVAA